MLKAKVSKLDGVLFTHEHADHTAGLDDIRPFCFRQGAMPFYLHKRVLGELKTRFDYIFTTENKYPGSPVVEAVVIENKPFKLNNLEVTPINGYHNKLQVFGFRFLNFAYLTDMKTIEPEELDKLKNLDVLVINALRESFSPSHFTLSEALDMIEKIKPKKAYLTHISHQLGFHDEVEAHLPDNVHLAFDELTLNIK